MSAAQSAIGVFDSGVGGLSVLQALRQALPHERLVYLADSAYAPYGERGEAFVQQRVQAITQFLTRYYPLKALVVACNTATTAAIAGLRQAWPLLPVVGVEPAIKPAAQATATGHIAVMATRGTVHSQRFAQLVQQYAQGVQVHALACDGLAAAIERSTWQSSTDPQAEVQALCARYVAALGPFGTGPGQVDTLVLGCTHYVFAASHLSALLADGVRILDTGAAVARQTRHVLHSRAALAEPESPMAAAPVELLTTGSLPALQAAAGRWLQLAAEDCRAVQLPVL